MKRSIYLLTIAMLLLAGTFAASCGTAATPAGQPTAQPPAPTTTMAPAPTATAVNVAVTIENYTYVPATLKIAAGTTVTWTNKDSVSHTVTSRQKLFDSGLLSRGQSFSYTFKEKGEYDYYCIPHPYMTGKVTVE